MAGVIDLRLHSFGTVEFLTRIPMSLRAGLGRDILNFILCVVGFFIIGYFVAYVMIGKFRYATPGRLGNDITESSEIAAEREKIQAHGNTEVEHIIALLGGRDNIVFVDACMTRLRVTVKDAMRVAPEEDWKRQGALGVFVRDTGVQAVYGPRADVLKSDINDAL
jgi:PTS system glucose-specific IIC component